MRKKGEKMEELKTQGASGNDSSSSEKELTEEEKAQRAKDLGEVGTSQVETPKEKKVSKEQVMYLQGQACIKCPYSKKIEEKDGKKTKKHISGKCDKYQGDKSKCKLLIKIAKGMITAI